MSKSRDLSDGKFDSLTLKDEGDPITLKTSLSTRDAVIKTGDISGPPYSMTDALFIENDMGIILHANKSDNVVVGGASLQIKRGSSNVTQAIFQTSGQVGINTTSPQSYYADSFVIFDNGNESGLTLATSSTNTQYLAFADNTTGDARYRGYLKYNHNTDSMSLATSAIERIQVTQDGEVTKPYQPSFMVTKTGDQTLVIGSLETVTWQNEIWDVGGNFSGSTFTAPVTGKYYLQTQMRIDSFDTSATYYSLYIVTSNRTKYMIIDPNFTADLAYYSMSVGSVFDMDAGDVAYVAVYQSGGTASHIDDSSAYTSFSGYLLG